MTSDAEDVTDLVRSGAPVRPVRPDFAFMRPRLSRWIALGCGSGLATTAPGTVGTLFGWLTFTVIARLFGDPGVIAAIVAGLAIGPWAIGRTGRDLGARDHGAIVWDEIVAIWLVLLLVPATFTAQLVAFLLFRAFDVIKPPPIGVVDRRWRSAIGVIADDLLAAGYTVLAFALGQRLLGGG
ncbi:MAG: phosphatidylglycerophosphatase A [Lautropia sp.]